MVWREDFWGQAKPVRQAVMLDKGRAEGGMEGGRETKRFLCEAGG